VEGCLAYLALVNLAILAGAAGAGTNDRLKRANIRLERTGMGAWRAALRTLPGLLGGLSAQTTLTRASQRLVEQLGSFIEEVNDRRNRAAHHGAPSDHSSAALVQALSPGLEEFLAKLDFIRSAALLRVERMEKHGSLFIHTCRRYTGPVPVYPVERLELSIPLDSDCLWLLAQNAQPISLAPWIVHTPANTGGEEVVWFFNTLDRDKGVAVYKNFAAEETRAFAQGYQRLAEMIL
jgi:hypothetical protein